MSGKYWLGLAASGVAGVVVACSGSENEPAGEQPVVAATVQSQQAAQDVAITVREPAAGSAFEARGVEFIADDVVHKQVTANVIELSHAGKPAFRVTSRVLGHGSSTPWRAGQGGLTRSLGDGVSQQVKSLDVGVQTAWTVDSERESFEARLDVANAVLRSVDADGLHFERDGQRFKVSHGSWFDADDRHTEIRAQFADGQVRYRVPRSVLASSSYPARLDPIISAEFFAGPALDAAGFSRDLVTNLVERSNGEVLFYTDSRLDLRSVDPTDGSVKLAFSADGLFANPNDVEASDVAVVGGDVVLAWIGAGVVNVRRLDLVTLDWKDPAPIPVSNILNNAPVVPSGSLSAFALRIVSNGSSLLVTWADDANVVARGRDSGYALLDASTLTVSTSGFLDTVSTADDIPAKAVVTDGGDFGVVVLGDDVSSNMVPDLVTVSSAGAVTGSLANVYDVVGLASSFGGYVFNGTDGFEYREIDTSGAAVGSPVPVSSPTGFGVSERLAKITGGVMVVGQTASLVAGGTATVLTVPGFLTQNGTSMRLLGLASGDVVSARFLSNEARGTTLSLSGTTVSAGADYPVGNAFVGKGPELATAYDATNNLFYVVWDEADSQGIRSLHMSAFEPFSNTRKFGPVTLHTQATNNDSYTNLNLATDAGTVVAEWTLARRGSTELFLPVLQRFQGTDGAPIDAGPVQLSAASLPGQDGGARVNLAWGGGMVYASWYDASSSTATRVAVDVTAATLAPQPMLNAEVLPFGPMVGNTFAGFSPGNGSAIYGTALTAASKVQDLCTTETGSGGPSLGEDWRDSRLIAGTSSYFLGCGSVCEVITAADGNIASTACGFPAGNRLAGFASPHFVSARGLTAGLGGPIDEWRVSSAYQDGTVMPTFSTSGTVATGAGSGNSSAATAPGAMLIAYFAKQSGAGVDQVFLRWVDPGNGLTAGCTDPADCASGVCDNGTCAPPPSGMGGSGGSGGSGGTGGSAGSASSGGSGGSTGGSSAGGSSAGGSSAGGSSSGGGSGGSATGGSSSGGNGPGGSSSAGTGNAAGTPGSGGTPTTGGDSGDDDGCGCSTPGSDRPVGSGWAFATLLGLLGVRGARRARR